MIERLSPNLKYDPPLSPPGVEFLGEVATVNFINGEALASAIDLDAGIAQHNDSPWLHFVLDGKTLYVAKKPYRYNLSWDHINATGAVFGTRTVTIKGLIYKVRLLKSATGDRYTGSSNVLDPVETYGSEWNRLMYPIHSGEHIDTRNPSPVSGEGLYFGTLAQYADTDLVVDGIAGNGSRSWCQEIPRFNTGFRVHRGYDGVSYLNWNTASSVVSSYGWRPVLELIE